MRRMLLVLALLPLLGGCAARTYNVRAYDLTGKRIYEGRLVQKAGSLKTTDGKSVMIMNATVIMEEVQ